MATYTGMTYIDIIKRTKTLADKYLIPVDKSDIVNFFDESLLIVGRDVLDVNLINSVSYPAGTSIPLNSNDYLYPKNVYGDATPFIKLDYKQYRELFLGSESEKLSGDFNYYYTILGDNILLEPSVSGFTNLIIEYSPLFTQYETDGSIDSTEPELPFHYRFLVCFKILELLAPPNFKSLMISIYKRELKNAKRIQGNLQSKGHAEWWNHLDIDTETR